MKTAVDIFKEIRSELGLSQCEIGTELGVSRDVIAGWENGRARIPADMLMKAQKMAERNAKRQPADDPAHPAT